MGMSMLCEVASWGGPSRGGRHCQVLLTAARPMHQACLLSVPKYHHGILMQAPCLLRCQFMESYKSVKLAAVADSFGVGADFMDRELSEFIVAGRLPAKIDKVAGVVETNRCSFSTGC